MISHLVSQGVFTNAMGNVFVNSKRNADISRLGVGLYRVKFAGALGIHFTDLQVSTWVKDNSGLLPRNVNVVPFDDHNIDLHFYDGAALTDDFICGFSFSAVEGG